MTFKDLLQIAKQIGKGELTIDQLKKHYHEALENENAIKDQIDKQYTLADLKKRFYTTHSKKSGYVNAFYDYLLDRFNISGKGVTYSWGEKYVDKLTELIESQTQADLDAYVKATAEKTLAHEKALTNPETLDEFRTFIHYKGSSALSPDQKKTYDRLLADKELDIQARDDARKSTVKAVELGDVEMELKTTKHTKKDIDLWVVTLATRVEKDKYNELNRKAKQLGGYYSAYNKGGAIPGFQFTTEQAAKQFMALKEGDVKKEDKAEKKQASVAERLLEMADRWEEEARGKFNQDRKENTARRARQASYARDTAETRIRAAKILRNIAQGLEKGEIKYLSRIDSAVQLDTIRQIWTAANYRRFQKSEDKTKRWDKWELDLEKDIDFVVYPYPYINAEFLLGLVREYGRKKGFQLIANRLEKKANNVIRHPEKHLVYFTGSGIDDARKFVAAVSNAYDKQRLSAIFEDYDRVQRMGLTTLPLIKTALREYHEYTDVKTLTDEERNAREMKDLENSFRGEKIDGFFPTPSPMANELVNLADIQPGDRVLEPSAGLGHIAEIIRTRYPDNPLTLIEQFWPLAEALQKKGFDPVRGDFLEHKGEYDKIVMNPPFERDQDIEHVQHAFSLLAPGGRLVAIMAGNKEGSNKKKAAFRELIDEYGYIQENAPDAFKSSFRPTAVRTVTVVLDKPSSEDLSYEEQLSRADRLLPQFFSDRGQNLTRSAIQEYLPGRKGYTVLSGWMGERGVIHAGAIQVTLDKATPPRDEKTIQREIEKVEEAMHERAKAGRGQGGSAGALNRDIAHLGAKKDKLKRELEKSDCPKEMAIDQIHIDEARFQNRAKLNETIVAQIAENFDENQLDPVVVWDDPQNGKTFLLAGHHRLAGAKRAGKTNIKTRCFEGTEKEAIAYAKELSNANRTLETPLERAKIYRQKLEKGEDPKKVRAQAEKLEGKNWRYILNLAALNPDGKIANALLSLADSSDKTTQQNLEKIADWAGEARRTFDRLTNAHENEIYDFLLENFAGKKPAISRKDVWMDRINGIVSAMDFDPDKALNLKRIQYKTQGESEYERQMAEIDAAIKDAEAKKQELKDRFNKLTHPSFVSPNQPDYDSLQRNADQQIEKIDAELKSLRARKLELAQKKGQMIQGGMAQLDIFSAAARDVDMTVNEIRRRQRKPERKEHLLENYEDAATEEDYIQMVRAKLDRARNDQVHLTEAQIIELGILIQPLVQSFGGALIDVMSTNKRVLAPTFNNLLRWAQKPGRYDLVGVDIAQGEKPTVLARKVKRARIFNLLGLK